MIEMLGGLLGAAGGIAGGIMQAEAAEYAADTNWRINVMNMQARERERAEAIAMANKLRKEQHYGTTNKITGERNQFIPGQGWVTTGSPEAMAMKSLQDAEQMKVLTHDLPMRRKVMDRNYARSLGEEAIADTYRRMLSNVTEKSDEGLASDLYQAQAMGLREASSQAGGQAFTQAMRTGQNSNFSDIAAGLQRETNKGFANAALQSKLMSRGLGAKEAAEKRSQMANLYNLFATRAGQLPEVSYKPQAIGSPGGADSEAKNALIAGQDLTKMFAMKGGELDYVQPNYGWANAVGGGASALASAFRAGGAKQQYDKGNSGGGVSGFGGYGDSTGADYTQDEFDYS